MYIMNHLQLETWLLIDLTYSAKLNGIIVMCYLIGGEERTSPIRDEVLLNSLSYGARMLLDRATLGTSSIEE